MYFYDCCLDTLISRSINLLPVFVLQSLSIQMLEKLSYHSVYWFSSVLSVTIVLETNFIIEYYRSKTVWYLIRVHMSEYHHCQREALLKVFHKYPSDLMDYVWLIVQPSIVWINFKLLVLFWYLDKQEYKSTTRVCITIA